MTRTTRTLLPLSLLALPVAACGLDRPVEQQPLVSVVEEWRQQVLVETTLIDTGTPVEVTAADLGGDLGDVTWDGRLSAEGSGSFSDELASVSILAGGGGRSWGMAIVGFVMPPRALVVPGVWTEVEATNASVVGCTGEVLFDWTTDESSVQTDLAVTRDAEDPALVHFEFMGEFVGGNVLDGTFTMRLPDEAANATP